MAPLTSTDGSRVLVINATPNYRSEILADFTRIEGPLSETSVGLDRKHSRDLVLFTADGFQRRPRDPATGRPIAP